MKSLIYGYGETGKSFERYLNKDNKDFEIFDSNISKYNKDYDLKNFDKIEKAKRYSLGNKYKFLDNIFLKVLKDNPKKMPNIFFKMFKCPPNSVIKFLSNKSNILEDMNIISKMPKLIFIKTLFN